MTAYDSLVDAIEDLRNRGYDRDFNLKENYIECVSSRQQLSPKEFEIIEAHRFEGMSDPEDESVIYVIESKDGLKGILINAYGPNADPISQELIAKLRTHH